MATKVSRAARLAVLAGVSAATTGCDPAVRAKVPPVPAAPAPLILAQTTVELPSPQTAAAPPQVPQALANVPVAEAVEPVIQIPRRVPAAVRPRPQEPGRPVASKPLSQIPSPQAETSGPLSSGEDSAKSTARIQTRVNDLRRKLLPYANSANAGTKTAASRIESFLRLADQEIRRGDLRQADAMADRAQALLQELAR